MSYNVGFISLGCPKNQVDAELMLAKIQNAGFNIVDVAYEAVKSLEGAAFVASRIALEQDKVFLSSASFGEGEKPRLAIQE